MTNSRFNESSFNGDVLFLRTSPAALVTLVMSALNAREMSAVGALIMGSVKMVSMATGSAIAMKVFMAPHVRTVNREDMASTVHLVRTHFRTQTAQICFYLQLSISTTRGHYIFY